MAFYSFVDKIKTLGSGAVTVREQARIAENPDQLRWNTLFPRVSAPSIKLSELYAPQHRPMADRRPWEAGGRVITVKNPKLREVEMLPIEGKINYGEREMQLMIEQHAGNQAIMANQLKLDIDLIVSHLNDANNRRIEKDAFESWLNNQVTVRNPVTGGSTVVPLNYDAARYITEDWSGTNAYTLFLAAIRYAIRTLPNVVGCMMRESTYSHIVTNGPSVPGSTAPMTRTQFLQNLTGELGQPFGILVDERSADEYQGADTTVTSVNYFTAQKVAFLTSSPIGNTHFAPVARAYNFMNDIPTSLRNANGFWTFIESQNSGKNLEVQAQVNALTIPNENNVLVYSVNV